MQTLTKSLEYILATGVPGVSAVVNLDGKEIYRNALGFRDAAKTTPMDGKELLNFYSMSKPITCAAAMLLRDEGRLRLSDPIRHYLPAYREMTVRTETGIVKAERDITVEHLMTMTAGLNYSADVPAIRDAIADTDGKCPTVRTMEYLAREPLDFQPGTKWQYSLCHDVLAAVVEVVSGERFGAFVKKRIFDPLGMEKSTFLLPASKLWQVSDQFGFVDDRLVSCSKDIQRYKFGSEHESGGAGLVSTIDDYMKFAEALRTGSILKKETIAEMTVDRIEHIDRSLMWLPEYGYGLGLRMGRAGSGHTDFGWGGAAGAYLIVDPVRNMTAVFGMHTHNTPEKNHCRDLMRDGVIALSEK